MEKWREKMGLESFFLAGHSLGAYLSGLYASKYQQHIRKLVLMSPAGVKARPDHELTNEFIREDLNSTHPGGINCFEAIGLWISTKHVTPYQVLRFLCYCTTRLYM